MEPNFTKEQKYLRAKNRVDELKGYYWHLATYAIVNTFISIAKISNDISEGQSFEQAFFNFESLGLWLVWGIGLMFHSFKVFGFPFFLGKNWEERKIKEFMNEEKL